MFYTRLPVPKNIDHSAEALNKSTVYFPVIGWIVGVLSAAVFYLSALILPLEVAVVFYMITSILVTGAFHEDGFADVCDGFGGGWTKEKILTIMKDSVIGAYGAIGIGLILLLKFLLVKTIASSISLSTSAIVLVCAHSISRGNALSLIFTDSYVRENEDSKAKPIAKGLTLSSFLIAVVLALLPLVLLKDMSIFLSVPSMFLVRQYFSAYFKKWIGGYTGDCLGAVQQVSEIAFYLTFILSWKYI